MLEGLDAEIGAYVKKKAITMGKAKYSYTDEPAEP
jgi:hypothetical protein